jgi:hypothetical protein
VHLPALVLPFDPDLSTCHWIFLHLVLLSIKTYFQSKTTLLHITLQGPWLSNWTFTSTIQIIQPTTCKFSQVYYLTFMFSSTCFGRLTAHYQEHTTALEASRFTVGEKRLERCWSWSGRPRPTALLSVERLRR